MGETAVKKNSVAPIIILGALFFIFGFVTWLNGTLIPYLRIACELKSSLQSLLVAFAFYISYFFTALPMSWVLRRTGYKKGMMFGLGIMAVGTLIFIPAALTRTYGLFLTGLFVIGTGLSLLQTASNPYITLLGDLESAAARISIMGICNKVAGVLAPLILGALVLSDADQLTKELQTLQGDARTLRLDELAHRAIVPYACISAVLVGLALFIRYSGLPELEDEKFSSGNEKLSVNAPKDSVFAHPNLVLGVIAIFVYVGVEVIAGDTIAIYGQSIGIPLSLAKTFTAYTLSAMVIGYLIGIATIPKFIRQDKALMISCFVGILFSLFIQFTHGYASVLFIALLGLANALMWPAIWPLAIEGLGKFTKIGSALLIMGIAGGALLPLLYGRLADVSSIGHQHAYLVLLPCYFFILYYAWKGHRFRSW
ncbi:MAG: sugar MFS transporter [Chitinophagales bacterium]